MNEYVACLKALTPETKSVIGGAFCSMPRFPFRVGRESRTSNRSDGPVDIRRKLDSRPNNDLYIVETGTELNVSREHFLIDINNGEYVIIDKGSSCGTIVEGEQIGVKRQTVQRCLEDGDVIIVGTSGSKFIFKFVLKRP